ncbi:unnamed protein product [Meganyctiphanes norvegica]|uniref:REJ domain-containing protein n=1 Tax=Meganyctiphanes norvegica TaxID=48144 RepID=A0AAV2S2G7_MEGNR
MWRNAEHGFEIFFTEDSFTLLSQHLHCILHISSATSSGIIKAYISLKSSFGCLVTTVKFPRYLILIPTLRGSCLTSTMSSHSLWTPSRSPSSSVVSEFSSRVNSSSSSSSSTSFPLPSSSDSLNSSITSSAL